MKILLFLFLSIFIICPLLGQKPTMQERKKMYDFKNYEWQMGDRYNPGVAGVLSFVIPGVGQMVSGEVGRGFAFLIPTTIAEIVIYDVAERIDNGEISNPEDYATRVIISGIAVIVFTIWSTVDAVQVAKVNNMYLRDKSKNDASLKIEPYANILPDNNVGYGLSLRINF